MPAFTSIPSVTKPVYLAAFFRSSPQWGGFLWSSLPVVPGVTGHVMVLFMVFSTLPCFLCIWDTFIVCHNVSWLGHISHKSPVLGTAAVFWMNAWETACILVLSALEHASCNFPTCFPDLLDFSVYSLFLKNTILIMIMIHVFYYSFLNMFFLKYIIFTIMTHKL